MQELIKKSAPLLDDMAETMYKANGVGLAAPQVGESIQVVVIDVGEGLIELVNPEIVRMEGAETDSEGCLSGAGDLRRCGTRRQSQRKIPEPPGQKSPYHGNRTFGSLPAA